MSVVLAEAAHLTPDSLSHIKGHYLFFTLSFSVVFLKFPNRGYLLYNVVLVSAIYQQETATGIHTSPPSGSSLPSSSVSHPSRLPQSPGLGSQHHTANSHLLSVLQVVINVSMLFSLFILPSPSSSVHKSVLGLCLHCCPAKRNLER